MSERLGQYELVRHLATGGMAEIFIARQSGPTGLDRELAIKRILPHLAREERFISMFLDEARIAARLRHPNIVQIYELGEEDGEYFIAMEYIEGGDLADLLDKAEERHVEVPIAMSVRIIADVLAALDYAHDFSENGKPLEIVHRDVSPHNVLIGRDGMIKLVDFGIAHAAERHTKTETGLVKGKLSYMAPEQVEQVGVDRRADIFSAGILLYELLTGTPPFGRELAAVSAILHKDPESPQAFRPDVPDELVTVVLKALAKSPDDRYQTAQQMLEALEGVLRVFDKYVSPKHVARFADALMNDREIEGFDDVSQAIPRAVSNEAMLRAASAARTPIPSDNSADTVEDFQAADAVGDLPVRVNEYGGARRGLPPAWYVAGAAVLLTIGGGLAVFGGSSKQAVPVLVAEETPPQGEVIELDDQFVAVESDDQLDAGGFTFDREELELAELEGWVETLEPSQVDRMLAANFEWEDGDYLWAVRSSKLARDFATAPTAINPGDPRAPKLLGLEALDEAVLKRKPRRPQRKRVKRAKRVKRPRKFSPKPKSASTKPAVEPLASKPKATPTKKAKPTTKKRRKKNTLRIIDQAVPY